jgi:hypothetical protein
MTKIRSVRLFVLLGELGLHDAVKAGELDRRLPLKG